MNKPERNDPCPCGSGKKYKKCCGLKEGGRTIKAVDLTKAASNMPQFFKKTEAQEEENKKTEQET